MPLLSVFLSRPFVTAFCGLALLAALPIAEAEVRWSENIEQSLKTANGQQRLVLMKFTATWCGPCRQMEKVTFGDKTVSDFVNQNFVPVLVDGDKHRDLAKHLQVKAFPSLLIVSPEMVIVHREMGFKTASQLLPILKTLASQHQASLLAGQNPQLASGNPQPAAARQTPPQTAAVPVSQSRPGATVTRPAHQPSFGGLCLPGVFQTRSLVKGTPEFGLRYRGKVLYFSSAVHRDQFKAAPEKYWPSRDGACPVTLAEEGRVVEGQLQYAAMFRDQLWLTSSPEKMQRFVALPASFVDALPR